MSLKLWLLEKTTVIDGKPLQTVSKIEKLKKIITVLMEFSVLSSYLWKNLGFNLKKHD